MLKVEIIAVSRAKKGPLAELIDEYKKRIQWPLTIHEVESKYSDPAKANKDESDKILNLMNSYATVIVMDERGQGLRSMDFAQTIETFKNNGENHLQFIIGGADGLTNEIRDKANILLSFGQQTWPHLLARVMLLEQIYRAQQILSGHPYHRE